MSPLVPTGSPTVKLADAILEASAAVCGRWQQRPAFSSRQLLQSARDRRLPSSTPLGHLISSWVIPHRLSTQRISIPLCSSLYVRITQLFATKAWVSSPRTMSSVYSRRRVYPSHGEPVVFNASHTDAGIDICWRKETALLNSLLANHPIFCWNTLTGEGGVVMLHAVPVDRHNFCMQRDLRHFVVGRRREPMARSSIH